MSSSPVSNGPPTGITVEPAKAGSGMGPCTFCTWFRPVIGEVLGSRAAGFCC